MTGPNNTDRDTQRSGEAAGRTLPLPSLDTLFRTDECPDLDSQLQLSQIDS